MAVKKYKLNELAKDLKLSSAEVIECLGALGGDAKKTVSALTPEEVSYVFEFFTQKNQVENFNAYFAANVAPEGVVVKKKAAPKAEEKKEEPKKAEEKKPEPKAEVKTEVKAEAKKEAPKAEEKKAAEAAAAEQAKNAARSRRSRPRSRITA